MINAKYSNGSLKGDLKVHVEELVKIASELKELTYVDTLNLLSLCILFDMKDYGFKISNEEDGLVKVLVNYINNRANTEKGELVYPKYSQKFIEVIDKKDSDLLIEYMNNTWYQSNEELSWYDNHKSNSDTYTGYWSYTCGAIIKILEFDKNIFRDVDYVPLDLI